MLTLPAKFPIPTTTLRPSINTYITFGLEIQEISHLVGSIDRNFSISFPIFSRVDYAAAVASHGVVWSMCVCVCVICVRRSTQCFYIEEQFLFTMKKLQKNTVRLFVKVVSIRWALIIGVSNSFYGLILQ